MRKALRASKLMGLLLLPLGAMGFSATAAQAELGAHWNVNGSEYKTELSVSLSTAIEGTSGSLLSKVGVSTVAILCTTIKLVDALLSEVFRATGRIHFEGCITKLNGSTAGACKPHSPGAAQGLIETGPIDALIVLHIFANVDLIELSRLAGESFAILVMGGESESECAIGESFGVRGRFFVKEAQEEGLVEKVTHLVVEGPLTELFFGENKATLDGSANLSLGVFHKGLKFSWIAK